MVFSCKHCLCLPLWAPRIRAQIAARHVLLKNLRVASAPVIRVGAAMSTSEANLNVTVKWNGTEHSVDVHPSESVACLKRKLEASTGVEPRRQKLLGLKTSGGKLPNDTTLIQELALKSGVKIMMMGCVWARDLYKSPCGSVCGLTGALYCSQERHGGRGETQLEFDAKCNQRLLLDMLLISSDCR